ncbi:MAG: helix-turn-helix domain-containing protein [Coriobacteriales bacterium]
MSLNAAYTLAPRVEMSEQELFYSLLLHDDRNSRYILSSDEGGMWRDRALYAAQLPGVRFDGCSNYYLTHNGFSSTRRTLESTRQVNAVFLDVDAHGSGKLECRRAVARANQLLAAAVDEGRLPLPTMVVDSGRGLHLYYVLHRSIPYRVPREGTLQVNTASLEYFADVQRRLAGALAEVLAGVEGLEVDRSVLDHARVGRIPGTYNAKAGRYARLIGSSGALYTLDVLGSYRPAAQPAPAGEPKPAPKRGKVVRFQPLMHSRITKLAQLQEHRGFDCRGTRELMCFVYYNSAVQLYERSVAMERTEAFNARFKQPLQWEELSGIASAVDSVVNCKGERGYYPLSAQTLVNKLQLTQAEIDELHFFSSKRTTERAAAKAATRQRREERNAKIVELYTTKGMTQPQVAAAVGCSARTVFSVLKEAGITRAQERHASAEQEATEIQAQAVTAADPITEFKAAGPKSTSLRAQLATSWHTCLGAVQQPPAGELSSPVLVPDWATPARRLVWRL